MAQTTDTMKIGRHVSSSIGHIVSKLRQIYMSDGNAAQIYIGSPKMYATPTISKKEIEEVKEFCRSMGCYLIVHGAYIYNFCNPKLNPRQIPALTEEFKAANELGADLIIHQGKNINKLSLGAAIDEFVKGVTAALSPIIDTTTNFLILENSSRQGTEIGYSIQQLHQIYQSFDRKYQERIGFCIDLCHVFVSGKMDVRSSTAVNKFFKRFDRKIGLSKLRVIHFNDSATPFTKCNDHHDNLLEGYIGSVEKGGSSDGMAEVARIAMEHHIPLICETPLRTSMESEFNLIRELASR